VLESLIDGELGRGVGIAVEDGVVKTAEEGDAGPDLIDGEDAGVEAVVEVGGEVGDLVGEVDELGLERGEAIEEIPGELRMVLG
jgi:hypothetical protein